MKGGEFMLEKVLRPLVTVLAGVFGLLITDRILLMLPPGVLPEIAMVGIFGVTIGTIFFYILGGLSGALCGYVLTVAVRIFGALFDMDGNPAY